MLIVSEIILKKTTKYLIKFEIPKYLFNLFVNNKI